MQLSPLQSVQALAALFLALAITLTLTGPSSDPARERPHATTQVTSLAGELTYPGEVDPVLWDSAGGAALYLDGYGLVGAWGNPGAVPIASVAKAMTAHVILLDHPLAPGEAGPSYTVTAGDVAETRRMAADGHSHIPVREGEVLSQRKMLEALMLPSANNVAHMLARWSKGSVEAFLGRMNEEAAKLGMHTTRYTDPSGFDAGTTSTPADQVLLAQHAMTNPTFAEVVGMRSSAFETAGVKRNGNRLLGQAGFVGLKTGTMSSAGGCLLFTVQREVGGETVTMHGIVLGQKGPGMGAAAARAALHLADEGYQMVSQQEVAPSGNVVGVLSSSDGRRSSLHTKDPISLTGLGGAPLPTRTELGAEIPLQRDAEAGTYIVEGWNETVSVPVTVGGAHIPVRR